MFSRKMMMIVGLVIVLAVNIIILSINSRQENTSHGAGGIAISLIAPFQKMVTGTLRFTHQVWSHYFNLASTAEDNDRLRQLLRKAGERDRRFSEIDVANSRMRSLLGFQRTMDRKVIAAEVIGKDPSPWFKTVIIDKGSRDGLNKGLPVVIPEGVVGQITEVAAGYAKVLLIIDQNNAVDALVQRTRARGIVTGETTGRCRFKYVLRKHDVQVGDVLISSGLDGVFPKGLRVGAVTSVIRRNSGIFQEVSVMPFVNFEQLEEVLIVLDPSTSDDKDAS
ncbi:MAG: rod shape-determining protein MreC [Desulfobacterales bacterium]|nr:rod shape-determining protein MreC [Desulfobacterales bacterium]